MIPLGYIAKHVAARPDWLKTPSVAAIHAVSGCLSPTVPTLDPQWRHNGWWFFDTPALAMQVARDAGADPAALTLFYCEAFESQFDADAARWAGFPRAAAAVAPPGDARVSGYDVVCFDAGDGPPGCSPLTCNGIAAEAAVNEYGLFGTLDEARAALDAGLFRNAEPGPYRILSVAVVPKP